MVCPHCKYEHGYNYEQGKDIEGDKGEFYDHVIEMKREDKCSYTRNEEKAYLHACPSCGIAFIAVN